MSLLQESEVADILLLSARGLTYLADVMPASCHSIVRHRAVPVLCERLLNIEYIDVAEQSLTVGPPDLYMHEVFILTASQRTIQFKAVASLQIVQRSWK